MKKKFAILTTAVLLSLGWILTSGAAAQADVPTYTLAAWKLGPLSTPADLNAASITNAFADQQKLVGQVDQTVLNLNALDTTLSPGCYQIDGYNKGDITTALLAGGVLNSPNHPAESLATGAPGLVGNPYKYICILPTEALPDGSQTCDTFTIPNVTVDGNTKYTLTTTADVFGPAGSRPVGGTYPLTAAVSYTMHTLASAAVVQNSKTYSFAPTACATPTPTPTPTEPATPPTGPKLALTGVVINWWLILYGVVLIGGGYGAFRLGRRHQNKASSK